MEQHWKMKQEAKNKYFTSHQRPLIPTQRVSSCFQTPLNLLQCAQGIKVL